MGYGTEEQRLPERPGCSYAAFGIRRVCAPIRGVGWMMTAVVGLLLWGWGPGK
jgi:hypothetical protein